MVERIMGKSRVCVINRNSVLDRFIWDDLTGQLRGKGYEIYCGQIGTHVSVHRGLSSALPPAASGMSRENERFDTTAIVRLNGDSISLTRMAWTGHGSRTLCLFTRREFIAVHSANFFHNPCFETVNEGFGMSDYALGGYFAPLETQLDDMAQGIAERLRGGTPDRQVRYCAKPVRRKLARAATLRHPSEPHPQGVHRDVHPLYGTLSLHLIIYSHPFRASPAAAHRLSYPQPLRGAQAQA